jgi:serine kinase of HPr protein (carbohydrate metabolism regulator)
MTGASLDAARAAKVKVGALVRDLPEFRGLGIAMLDDGFGVKVNFSRMPVSCEIPRQVDDVPVIVDIVGATTAL